MHLCTQKFKLYVKCVTCSLNKFFYFLQNCKTNSYKIIESMYPSLKTKKICFRNDTLTTNKINFGLEFKMQFEKKTILKVLDNITKIINKNVMI